MSDPRALVTLCFRGAAAEVRELLAGGADANARALGVAALEAALLGEHGREDDVLAIVVALLAAGADVGARDERGATALMTACRWPRVPELLLAHGADPRPADDAGDTALIWAASLGQVPSLRPFLARGARVDHAGANGRTALMHAVHGGNAVHVDELLAAGADVNTRDDGGDRPLLRALALGHRAIALRLIRAGAHLGVRDDMDRSVLWYAAAAGYLNLVGRMIRRGEALGVPDLESGRLPLEVAADNGHAEVVSALREAGAPGWGQLSLAALAACGFTADLEARLADADEDADADEIAEARAAALEHGRADVLALLARHASGG